MEEKAEEQWKSLLAKDSQRSYTPSVRGKMPEECVPFCVSVYFWTFVFVRTLPSERLGMKAVQAGLPLKKQSYTLTICVLLG